MVILVLMVIRVIMLLRVIRIRSLIGILTHQGHISKVNANAHSVGDSVTLIPFTKSANKIPLERTKHCFETNSIVLYPAHSQSHALVAVTHPWSFVIPHALPPKPPPPTL